MTALPGTPRSVFARLSDPNPPADTPVVIGTAIVLGGSVAGLIAARVLADHAETVLIVERDDIATSVRPRAGVPQSTQLHALLPSGLIQLERWYPGFTDGALRAGACPAPATVRRNFIDGERKVSGSPAPMLTASRPFLEEQIRRHTLALPNVKSIMARAVGVEFDGDAVTAVRIESGGVQSIERGDFVVDAMGRSSRLSAWLEQAGWPRPPLRRMAVDLNYATAAFQRTNSEPNVNVMVAFHSLATADYCGGAAICQVEGDRWLVMVAGYQDQRPGQTIDDLINVCRTEYPTEYGQVAANEPLGDVRTYRQADSRRRDFHVVRHLPARLIALGDAVASFNPLYAQGMSSAALQASCLSEFLRSLPDLAKPARAFFALQKVVVDAAWAVSTGADLALPHVNGPYPRGYRLTRRLGNQIVLASMRDEDICRRFEEVTYMLKHPSALSTPRMLTRSLRVNRRASREPRH